MTDQRFQQLLEGPLFHPMIPFGIMRLAAALRAVVDATGAAGERALEEHCAMREELDRLKAM